MNKPTNSTTDRHYQELSLALEATNAQIHKLRLRARELNEALTALKNGKPAPPKPAASLPRKSTSSTSPKSKSKLLAPDENALMYGVSD